MIKACTITIVDEDRNVLVESEVKNLWKCLHSSNAIFPPADGWIALDDRAKKLGKPQVKTWLAMEKFNP